MVIKNAIKNDFEIKAVNLPSFRGILSHFTQPGQMFADELSGQLKVIACIEKPHMAHSEQIEKDISDYQWKRIQKMLDSKPGDAQMVIWGPEEDIPTALETIKERCLMAFEGVPRESRKSFEDGTTIFERVLPGPDRMYPDTDSSPIPLEDNYIEEIRKRLPVNVSKRIEQLKKWGIPEDAFTYILRNNLVPLMEKIINDLKINPTYVGTLFGHVLKHLQGQDQSSTEFKYDKIYQLLEFLHEHAIEFELAEEILPELYRYPQQDFNQLLDKMKFRKKKTKDILARIPFVLEDFTPHKRINNKKKAMIDWAMGKLRPEAIGNIPLSELRRNVRERVEKSES
jgi:glutamyl-tRNA(Gln) amidotransferase subunit E